MNGMALASHKAGVFSSVGGMDRNGFALIAAVVNSAKLTDTDHSVAVNGADYHSESIGMSAHKNGF